MIRKSFKRRYKNNKEKRAKITSKEKKWRESMFEKGIEKKAFEKKLKKLKSRVWQKVRTSISSYHI